MAKFRADFDGEREIPSLGLTLKNGDIVELPADTNIAGLVSVKESAKTEKPVATPVAEEESE